jgi:hypothetical protein
MTDEFIFSKKILELVKTSSFNNLEELIEIIEMKLNISNELALKYIIELQNQGKIKLSYPLHVIPKNIYAYLFSIHAIWFWIILALSISTTISIIFIPERAFPYVYLRYILGSLFLAYLPGFSLIKTLFPTNELEKIERMALSVVMSIVIIALIGLILNYTPWGIGITSILISLFIFTVGLSITGLIREHSKIINKENNLA